MASSPTPTPAVVTMSSSSATTSASTSSNSILSGLQATLGNAVVAKIQSSRLLLVGAGGIGCELLKNLALTGFTKVNVIDLDTIDVSNLNRQLLFRSQHVGKEKCVVACQVAAQMAILSNGSNNNNNVEYIPHHANVCDASFFNVPFVSQFDLILNALDNVTARRRVNRLALASGVPLIEAGTTGYLGQVTVIDKASNVACYECKTQETAKVYPICTIRSTPSMPVHTIVWAKELYKLLFGDKVEESMLYEGEEGSGEGGGDSEMVSEKQESEEGGAGGAGEPSVYMQAVLDYRKLLQQDNKDNKSTPCTASATAAKAAAHALLTAFYASEIQKQLDMDRYKTAQKKPQVLSSTLLEDATSTCTVIPPSQSPTYNPTDIWSPTDCVAEFTACLVQAATQNDTTDDPILPAFDKDDWLGMAFVTAASNLRSHVFGIEPLQSFYSAKGIAGNIIPAIATTNAICAGLQILQAFCILAKQVETNSKNGGGLDECCRYVNCIRNPTRNGLYLTATQLEPPNPHCYVCSKASVPLALNLEHWTLSDLLVRVLKKDLGFEEPTVLIEGDSVIWEEGQDADSAHFQQNLTKKLRDLPGGGIGHGTTILVEDFVQDLSVEIAVTHQDTWDDDNNDSEDKVERTEEEEMFHFVIGGNEPVAGSSGSSGDDKKPAAAAAPATAGDKENDANKAAAATDDKPSATADGDDDDDVIELVNGNDDTKVVAVAKRPPTENGDLPPAKKQKSISSSANNDADMEVIEIDD